MEPVLKGMSPERLLRPARWVVFAPMLCAFADPLTSLGQTAADVSSRNSLSRRNLGEGLIRKNEKLSSTIK